MGKKEVTILGSKGKLASAKQLKLVPLIIHFFMVE
jgi:hypothetical protein